MHDLHNTPVRRSTFRSAPRATALLGLVAVLVLGAALATRGAFAPTAARATGTLRTHLVAGYLSGLARATRVAAAPATLSMRIGVAVARPDTAGEEALFRAQNDPASPQYHHFLTPAQFAARFGVRPGTEAAVRHFLTAAGLRIDTAAADGGYLTATGTVAQLDRLFHVSIGLYTDQRLRFVANDAPPSVPDGLPIDAVLGLDTVHRLHTAGLRGHALSRTVVGRARARRALGRLAAPGVTAQDGMQQVYTPQDLWGIYDDPGASQLVDAKGRTNPATVASANVALGQGQTVGIFGEGETSSVTAQLRLFEHAVGLPRVPVRTVETEGPADQQYGDNSGAIEWYLDSQAITGMAPDVRQLDYLFSKSLFDADIAASFDYWANDRNGPRTMNASFGECEANPTNPVTGPLAQQPYGTELGDELEAAAEPMLRQASMEGRTLFSSSGDTGSGCPEVAVPVAGAGNGVAIQPVPLVGYPCASAFDVCVGGTVVSSPDTTYPKSAQRSAETSWTFGGGGTSRFIPAPSFQKGITAISNTCYSDPTGATVYGPTGGPLCRGVPDVSDLSGNTSGDGYYIWIDGKPSSEGGTSLSSPLMVGQWARIQSAAPAATQRAGGLGFADPVIYRVAANADTCTTGTCTGQYAQDFYDVTQGEDVSDVPLAGTTVSTGVSAGNGAYQPSPGWDYASGWGALNVANFMRTVDGSTSATAAYTGQEASAAALCTATMTSPVGNATDPVAATLGDVPGADLTRATLTSDAKDITATFTVPQLSSGPAPYGTGISFTMVWRQGDTVESGTATEDASGAFTYTDSGKTSKATGKVDTAKGLITLTIPLADVGSPAAGSLLEDVQAFDTLNARIKFTVDSAANFRPYSVDDGQLDSIGEDVVVGGHGCAAAPPRTSVATAHAAVPAGAARPAVPRRPATPSCQTTSASPVTHITHDTYSRRGAVLSGTAAAHCPARIVRVQIALARATRRHGSTVCAFLTGTRFGPPGACAPREYRTVSGTSRWSAHLGVALAPGVYHLWEHATDDAGRTTPNVASRYVFIRIR